MLWRKIIKSLSKNARMTIWTLITLTTCASLVTLFTTISLDVGRKMSSALRQIGANAMVYSGSNPVEENHLDTWQILENIVKHQGAEMTRLDMEVGTIKGRPVAIVMADPEELLRMTPYWAIVGQRTMLAGECLVGRGVSELLRLKPGMMISVTGMAGGDEKTNYRITGIVNSGDEDENRIFISRPSAQPTRFVIERDPSGYSQQGVLSYALLSVPEGEEGIKRLNEELRAAGAQGKMEVKPLHQILYGEKTTLEKVALLSGLSLLAVLILTSLGVSSAVLARIVERRKELALMRALGAKRRSIVVFLLLEGTTIGTVASVIGILIGTIVSQFLERQIFRTSVTPQMIAFPVTLIVTVGVSLLAGSIGAVRAMRIQPAVALKGE